MRQVPERDAPLLWLFLCNAVIGGESGTEFKFVPSVVLTESGALMFGNAFWVESSRLQIVKYRTAFSQFTKVIIKFESYILRLQFKSP